MDLNNHEEIRSFNFDMMIPTLIIFVLSLVYYYIKYRRLRNFHEENTFSQNQNTRENTRVNDLPEIEELLNNDNNANSNNNEDNTIRYPNLDDDLNSDLNGLKIFVQLTNLNTKKSFTVNKNQTIEEFKVSKVIPLITNREEKTVTFIFMGKKLDCRKTFAEYREISNNSVIHAFVHARQSSSEGQSSHSNEGAPRDSLHSNDPNAVYFNTIKTHAIILVFIVMFTALYKYKSNLFQKSALIIFQGLIMLWLTQVSNTLAKVYIHRKIIW